MSNERGHDPELENNPLWQLHRQMIDGIIDKTELEDWRFYDLRTENRQTLLDAIEQRGEFAPEKQIRPVQLDAIDTDAKQLFHESPEQPNEENNRNADL